MMASTSLGLFLMIPIMSCVAAVGAFVGWVTVATLRADRAGIVWDAALAPLAFLAVWIIGLVIPCRGCESVENGWTIRNSIPHLEWWALAAACLGPALHEVFRHGRRSGVQP
jgi:hypothetical protein